ncbi:hypothetical protein P4502_04870 [Peribacillus frigoritolerans]|uniref:hypothetical protein n=1 Tax=Peribacillus frigoritolerans TaxID=450367 RepID=UPI000AAB146D|nr:hypothetical protein [Peribacillus frigoritolerans]MED3708566.1 hypothetical protein [Peribacillus frigoritolerans]
MLVSSDDIFYPEKTEVQLDFMNKNRALFSNTSYYCINENGKVITPSLGIHLPNKLELIKAMSKGNIINGCTVMMNRKIFDLIGVFDETLPYTHDYDLWIRILQKFDIHCLSQPLLLYRVHSQMGSNKLAVSIKKETFIVVNRHRAKMKQLMLKHLRKQ